MIRAESESRWLYLQQGSELRSWRGIGLPQAIARQGLPIMLTSSFYIYGRKKFCALNYQNNFLTPLRPLLLFSSPEPFPSTPPPPNNSEYFSPSPLRPAYYSFQKSNFFCPLPWILWCFGLCYLFSRFLLGLMVGLECAEGETKVWDLIGVELVGSFGVSWRGVV